MCVCRPAGHTIDLTSASPTADRRAKVISTVNQKRRSGRPVRCMQMPGLRDTPRWVRESDGLLVLIQCSAPRSFLHRLLATIV